MNHKLQHTTVQTKQQPHNVNYTLLLSGACLSDRWDRKKKTQHVQERAANDVLVQLDNMDAFPLFSSHFIFFSLVFVAYTCFSGHICAVMF